jgi:hypothetical protein
MSTLTFPLFNNQTVRVTRETPPRASAIDIISVITEQTASNSLNYLNRAKEQYVELTTLCSNFKFQGRGQRDTPVVDARGAVTLINLLPGRKAAEFRSTAADVFVRFLGGDESLVAEIRANREAQEALAVQQPDHPARVFGETVEAENPALKRKREDLELEERRANVEKTLAEAEKLRLQSRTDLVNNMMSIFTDLGTMDDRTKMLLSDYGRGMLITPQSAHLALPAAQAKEEVTIEDVALEMGYRRPPARDLNAWRVKLGRAAARLYREAHDGESPPTTKRFCNGKMIDVKLYYKPDDMEVLSAAVRECC